MVLPRCGRYRPKVRTGALPVKRAQARADTFPVRRETKLDRLAAEFAAAVAADRWSEAEGWAATAFLAAGGADCLHTLERGRRACAECRSLQRSAR